jgi:hypothetical protein
LALLGGCAGAPQSSRVKPLLIDGQTPQAILGGKEMARINKRIPEAYRRDVARAEAFGRTIHAYYKLAHDAGKLVAPGGRSPFSYPAAGWVTEHTSKGLRFSFIVKKKDKIGIAAQVTRGREGLDVHRLSPPGALNSDQLALWQARNTAYEGHFKPCSRNYAPTVMPVSAKGNPFIYVFLLPVGTNLNTLYLGGYHRVIVSPNGRTELENHAYTHDCITLHRRDKGAEARLTESVSDSPTAPQVFASLRYDLPIEVKTLGNGLSWQVKDGTISLLSKHEETGSLH